MSKYKINVITLRGVALTFNVDECKIEGSFVSFFDTKTNKRKMFPSINTEIEVVDNE